MWSFILGNLKGLWDSTLLEKQDSFKQTFWFSLPNPLTHNKSGANSFKARYSSIWLLKALLKNSVCEVWEKESLLSLGLVTCTSELARVASSFSVQKSFLLSLSLCPFYFLLPPSFSVSPCLFPSFFLPLLLARELLQILLKEILSWWDVQHLKEAKSYCTQWEIMPSWPFLQPRSPGDSWTALSALPDVGGRKTQDTQSHLCLPILLGLGGPDPASWDETCGQKSPYLDWKDEPMVTEGKPGGKGQLGSLGWTCTHCYMWNE